MRSRSDTDLPFVTDCVQIPREDDAPLFIRYDYTATSKGIKPFLNNYVIVPRERFEDLLKKARVTLDEFIQGNEG